MSNLREKLPNARTNESMRGNNQKYERIKHSRPSKANLMLETDSLGLGAVAHACNPNTMGE